MVVEAFSGAGRAARGRTPDGRMLLEVKDDEHVVSDAAAFMDCTAGDQAPLERAEVPLDLSEQPRATPALDLALGSPPTARSRTRVPSTSSAPTTATARLR